MLSNSHVRFSPQVPFAIIPLSSESIGSFTVSSSDTITFGSETILSCSTVSFVFELSTSSLSETVVDTGSFSSSVSASPVTGKPVSTSTNASTILKIFFHLISFISFFLSFIFSMIKISAKSAQ